MRKFIRSSPLAVPLFLSIALTIYLLIANACRKIDERRPYGHQIDYTERFFRLSSDAHPAIKTIVKVMRNLDKSRKFVNKFVKQQGFAIWDKAIITPINNPSTRVQAQDYSVMIPLVWDQADLVHSAIAAKVTEDSVFFTLLDGSNYATYNADSASKGMNGGQLSMLLMYLDNQVFGHTMFAITDSAAFPNKDKYVKLVKAPDSVAVTGSEEKTVISSWVICLTFWTPGGWLEGCPPGDPNCLNYVEQTDCYSFVTIEDDGYEINDDYPPPPPNGGGGGSGGNDLCRLFPGTEHFCGMGGPPGWQPLDDQIDNPYNPNAYDSVFISRTIKDSFPCLYQYLKDSFQNANGIAQASGMSLFQDSTYMHLTFGISDSLTQQGQAAANTHGNNVFVGGDGITHYVAEIKFNSWYLKNGTREFMVGTIVHELLHAVFMLRWGQYLQWLQWHDSPYDSNYIKQHFPTYWYELTNQTVPVNGLQQHQMMAYDYVTYQENIVRPFFNPAASSAIRDTVLKAMAYGGLRMTTGWKLLPQQGVDTCKYAGIQIAAENSATGSIYPTGCSTSYAYHYSDDWWLRPNCN